MQLLLKNFRSKNFLLAVSGGVDSMVLVNLFQVSGFKFQVAHINYKLRDKDSDADQQLVEDFCKKNNIKFHINKASKKDKKPENSIQLWARHLRYDFFFKILNEENLDFLVTAHHLNDELETFIINLSRGSGIKGLSGIPANDNQILRPLLSFSKDDIYRFANENCIQFREDLSNQKNDYLRNKIRNEIVPQLLETNDNFLENFHKSLKHLNDTKNFVEAQISEISDQIIRVKDNCSVINKEKLSAQSSFVQFEILRTFGFDDEKEITKIFKAQTGKVFKSKDYQLVINRNELILENIDSHQFDESEQVELTINSKNEILIPKKIRKDLSEFGNMDWKFDADKLNFPLKLRHKKEGDEFFPMGMKGKKKISKFFKDEKISILAKPKIWLLCDGNDDVLGVLPLRQDRRFAADESTVCSLNLKI